MTTTTDGTTGPAPKTTDPIVRWLLMVAVIVVAMVLVGGFVRLSRAGLSIVEWEPITGVLPPIGAEAWEQSFAAYRQSPEYELVNAGMTLAEYQRIFYIEWAHRLIARLAGLAVVVPLTWFGWRRRLTLRESLPYWGVVALFGVQGVIGWLMVSSGLKDQPAVSHLRLTIHLLTAVALLAIVLWMAMERIRRSQTSTPPALGGRRLRPAAWSLLAAVVVQIALGGLVAGLKAGYLSNTWPLMFGRLVPSGLLAKDPWWVNLIEPLGAHWTHRWFAMLVAVLAVAVAVLVYRTPGAGRTAVLAAGWLLILVATQITLGIAVVVMGVPKWLALAHQGVGVLLFCAALVIAHQAHTGTHAEAVVATPAQV